MHKDNKRLKALKEQYPSSNIELSAIVNGSVLEGDNVICNNANISNSHIGFGTVVGRKTSLTNCLIGRFCSIAGNVHVVTPTHPLDMVSTYPSFFNTCNNYPFGKGKSEKNEFLKTDSGYSAEIGNDVWIGEGVTIKGGVKIGDGAVIAMNATVIKDVPPYAIVGGVPAKIIRFRMDDEQIEKMLKIKWWNWEPSVIAERREDFADINSFIQKHN